MSREQFEPQNTLLFTWVSSVSPDSAPILKITGVSNTVIASLTSVQSTTTNYYVPYTLPSTEGVYMAEWYAARTIDSVAYPFIKKFIFNIVATRRTF